MRVRCWPRMGAPMRVCDRCRRPESPEAVHYVLTDAVSAQQALASFEGDLCRACREVVEAAVMAVLKHVAEPPEPSPKKPRWPSV